MKKHKDILIGIIFVGIAVAAFVLMGWSNTKNAGQATALVAGPATLAAEETSFNFGTVSMARGNVTHDFAIKNATAEPVTITKFYTSCMCTEATLKAGSDVFGPVGMPGHGFTPSVNKTLAPREAATVTAIFNPAAHGPAGVGRADRTVYIENSGGRTLELNFSAEVTP